MVRRISISLFFLLIFGMIGLSGAKVEVKPSSPTSTRVTPRPKITGTVTFTVTNSATPSITSSPTVTPTATETLVISSTPTETVTVIPTITPAYQVPYPSAPLCPDSGSSHDVFKFHTLWDGVRGCHYDHEHGTTPFTQDVEDTFPDFNLFELLGNREVSSTNPSSPMEYGMKAGGYKWQVDVDAPNGCALGFEGGTVAIDAYAIQYHDFGPQFMEFEVNKHSASFLLRQCKSDNPSDKGYVFVTTLLNYGERCTPYQGQTLQYPDDFLPRWNCTFGPYLTTDNTQNRDPNSPTQSFNSKWSTKPTGCIYPCAGVRPPFNPLAGILFDLRDAYQILDASDLTYPFTWVWTCGINSYNPVGCRNNNSTSTIHEVVGVIPFQWDNVSGLDSDLRTGRITGEFFVDSLGNFKADCDSAGGDCYPVKFVSAFVGKYSSNLCSGKCSINTPENTPERDIYFCGVTVCNETVPGAVPSGWIGDSN